MHEFGKVVQLPIGRVPTTEVCAWVVRSRLSQVSQISSTAGPRDDKKVGSRMYDCEYVACRMTLRALFSLPGDEDFQSRPRAVGYYSTIMEPRTSALTGIREVGWWVGCDR